MEEQFLTTKQVAEELEISQRRVNAMIDAGRLPARKFGRDWMINIRDVDAVRNRNKKGGRPPKKQEIDD